MRKELGVCLRGLEHTDRDAGNSVAIIARRADCGAQGYQESGGVMDISLRYKLWRCYLRCKRQCEDAHVANDPYYGWCYIDNPIRRQWVHLQQWWKTWVAR